MKLIPTWDSGWPLGDLQIGTLCDADQRMHGNGYPSDNVVSTGLFHNWREAAILDPEPDPLGRDYFLNGGL